MIIYNGVTIGAKKRRNPENLKLVNENRYPIIGERVIIYSGAKVFGNITIGKNAIMGANSVVLQDIPAGATAIGIPARIIKNNTA